MWFIVSNSDVNIAPEKHKGWSRPAIRPGKRYPVFKVANKAEHARCTAVQTIR